MAAKLYCVDTSSLISLRVYHRKPLAPLWELLDRLATEGRLVSPREVLREVSKQEDLAHSWAKDHKSIFVDADDEQARIVSELQTRFPVLAEAAAKTTPYADPWCLALTMLRSKAGESCHLINEEKETPQASGKLPYLCGQLGLKWGRLLDVPGFEGLRFALAKD